MLEKLNFGRDDAESEQDFLQKVFFPTKLFEQVKSDQKWLVLGRKGSGKTAMCLSLLRRLEAEGEKVSLITPSNLSVMANAILSKGSIDTEEASTLSWEYVFLVELGKYLMDAVSQQEGKNYLQWPEEARKIRSFLSQRESYHTTWLDKVLKVVTSVNKIAFKVAPVEISGERNIAIQESSSLRDLIDEFTATMGKGVKRYLNQPIYILVDKIDELWNQKPESSDLIIGLLKAAKEVRSQIGQARITIFLRSDIFFTLGFHDSDKFHSIEERVTWDEVSLLHLISLRIRASIGGKATDIETWQKVFPKSIDGQDSYKYLLEYTLMRPRDLIQLCNHCRDVAQNFGLDSIDEASIRNALPDYSSWKLNDLRDEYQIQHPYLEKVFWGIFYGAPHRFTREVLNARIAPYSESLRSEFGEGVFDPIDNFIYVLFNIGFIGAVKPGTIRYFYQDVRVIVDMTSEFAIHPAFYFALNIVKSVAHFGEATIIKDRDSDSGNVIITKDNIRDDDSKSSDSKITKKPPLHLPRPKPPTPKG